MVTKGRKRISSVPANESAEQKLHRLAGQRVSAAIWRVRLVGNLANYKPNAKQVAEIISALKREVQEVERRLQATGDKTQQEPAFSLTA